jgi:hypothetical protein
MWVKRRIVSNLFSLQTCILILSVRHQTIHLAFCMSWQMAICRFVAEPPHIPFCGLLSNRYLMRFCAKRADWRTRGFHFSVPCPETSFFHYTCADLSVPSLWAIPVSPSPLSTSNPPGFLSYFKSFHFRWKSSFAHRDRPVNAPKLSKNSEGSMVSADRPSSHRRENEPRYGY